MQKTSIQWCDYSANLLKYRDASGKSVWACVKVSDGCKNCYAESTAKRWKRGGPFSLPVMKTITPFFSDDEAKKILRDKSLTGKKVFAGDMTDIFGEWVPDEIIDKHFAVFALRPDVTFQVLTKRPERMAAYIAHRTRSRPTTGILDKEILRVAESPNLSTAFIVGLEMEPLASGPFSYDEDSDWPLKNVWLGTSVENQACADERIPHLLRCSAAVRFLSVEPQLGPVDLHGAFYRARLGPNDPYKKRALIGVDWVIVGGESGPHARPFNVNWARSLRDQCGAAGVSFFLKQLGRWPVAKCPNPCHAGPCRNCGDTGLVTVHLKDSHGGNMAEWPEDLRVREFPAAVGGAK